MGPVSMLYLSLPPSKLLADPHCCERNFTATKPERKLLAHFGEQLSRRVISSIGADPMNDAMGNQGRANRQHDNDDQVDAPAASLWGRPGGYNIQERPSRPRSTLFQQNCRFSVPGTFCECRSFYAPSPPPPFFRLSRKTGSLGKPSS